MFTKTEKGYLVLTLAFLAAGSGIKAYRHATVKLGPFQEAPDAHEVPEVPEVPGAATVSWRGDASQSDGTGGRDTVSDSSNGSANPFSHGPASAKASESHQATQPSTSKTTSKTAFNGKVDLNQAEAPELTRVPGIGAKTAQAIVEHRRAHGPYREFRDLLQIKGIGEKKLEKLMPNLIL